MTVHAMLRPVISGIRSALGVNGLSETTLAAKSEISDLARVILKLESRLEDLISETIDLKDTENLRQKLEESKLSNIEALLRENFTYNKLKSKDFICKHHEFPGNGGWHMVLPAKSSDPVVNHYLIGEYINKSILDMAILVTDPGDQILDLGAHIGTFCVGAAALGRKVFAVDAAPLHIDLISRSKILNRLTDLTIVHSAISDQEGTVRFIQDGLFGTIDFSGKSPNYIEVPATSLDRLMEENAHGPVRFLKMDIEGSEFVAIASGKRLLEQDRPIIWFESNPPTLARGGHTVADLRALLESCGYKTFRIEGDRWIYAPPNQIQPEAWVDMVALSEPDQRRWSDRIQWTWHPADVLAKCREWASLTHEGTRRHLLAEIAVYEMDESIRAPLEQIRRILEERS